MPSWTRALTATALALLGAAPAGAAERPDFRDVTVTSYPRGGPDDLLTAGLGASGLQAAQAPAVADPDDPAQLRRLAIYFNYRALIDTTPAGGFGGLYGPTVEPPEEAGPGGEIYGTEYLALVPGRGQVRDVTVMVQIPDFFGAGGRPPCIVTAPSSGSRGVYGAIGTAGEWGLKKGCAVAYTDKGTGIGAHDLENDTVTLLRGQRVEEAAAGRESNFTAPISERERAAYASSFPNRWAFKHAHSEANPEAGWGQDVLRSIEFAFWALKRELGRTDLNPGNTLVIGSSVSNGGAASLRAAEEDRRGLIDAVVISEPNVNPRFDPRFGIAQADGSVLYRHSRPLYDYATLIDLYQGCANQAYLGDATLPLILGTIVPADAVSAGNRCRSLREAGLLRGANPATWPGEAQARINGYGILREQNLLAPSYWSFYVVQAVALTYANAYAKASVTDDLCGYSFAGASLAFPRPAPLSKAAADILFGVGNGIPPTGGIAPINNRSPGGALYDPASVSPTFGRSDQNLEGAACLRALWPFSSQARRGAKPLLRARLETLRSIAQIQADGRLKGVPTIILHGRNDPLIAPNHSSRAYYGLNLIRDGRDAPTRYYEVTNAQHLDAFNPLPGYSNRFIPLHHYFIEALDLMWTHLTEGAPLPPSQVVRTVPRAASAAITAANVPPVQAAPGPDTIRLDGRVLRIPR